MTHDKLIAVQLTDVEIQPFVIKYVAGTFKYGSEVDFWVPYGDQQYSICAATGFIYQDDYYPTDSPDKRPYLFRHQLVTCQTFADAEELIEILYECME